MNRRTVIAAPAALATSTALPAIATGAVVTGPTDYDAIRARIAQVCETFSKPTIAFPEPMPAAEAQAAMALTDAQIEEMGPVLDFAQRWGVDLDWLVKGDVGSLIHGARLVRQGMRGAGGAPADDDPAVVAYRAWREADEACREVVATGVDPSDELSDRESDALWKLADVVATTPAGLEAQIRGAFDIFAELRRDGDPTNPDDYDFVNGCKEEQDGRMVRSILGGTARLAAQETGLPVSYTPPPGKTSAAGEFIRLGELEAMLKELSRVGKAQVLRIGQRLVDGDLTGAEAA